MPVLFGNKWLRFLGIEFLLFLVFMLVGVLIAIIFKIFGLLLVLILFTVFRILYIYWEFTVVTNDLGIFEAFSQSKEYFRNRIPETSTCIIAIIGLGFVSGLIVNGLWNPFVLFLAIIVYGYLATGLQLALMMSLDAIKRRLEF